MPKARGPNAGPETRRAVLEAARRLFTRQGFDGTSMRDIATEVGLTNAALYYHFSSKDALLAALSQTRRDELDRLAEWVRTRPSSPGLLREIGLRWVDGATSERLEGLRLAHAIRPVLNRVVDPRHGVPGGFDSLVELFAPGDDRVEQLRVRLVFDAFGAAAGVAAPHDDLDSIKAAARLMVLGLTEDGHEE